MEKSYLEKYTLVTGANQKVLRTICKPVHSITPEIKQFAELLLFRMEQHNGVGIAAPQVGRPIQMAAFCVLDISSKNTENRSIIHEDIMINPKVIAISEETDIEEEGCLSLPGEQGSVARPQRATIQRTDLKGKTQLKKVEGYNARIMLHEIDHLNGILFIDKLS